MLPVNKPGEIILNVETLVACIESKIGKDVRYIAALVDEYKAIITNLLVSNTSQCLKFHRLIFVILLSYISNKLITLTQNF